MRILAVLGGIEYFSLLELIEHFGFRFLDDFVDFVLGLALVLQAFPDFGEFDVDLALGVV